MKVNGKDAGTIAFGANDGALGRHQIRGDWLEQSAEVPATLLKSGKNTISLTVLAGNPNAGVIYDDLRLEINEETDS